MRLPSSADEDILPGTTEAASALSAFEDHPSDQKPAVSSESAAAGAGAVSYDHASSSGGSATEAEAGEVMKADGVGAVTGESTGTKAGGRGKESYKPRYDEFGYEIWEPDPNQIEFSLGDLDMLDTAPRTAEPVPVEPEPQLSFGAEFEPGAAAPVEAAAVEMASAESAPPAGESVPVAHDEALAGPETETAIMAEGEASTPVSEITPVLAGESGTTIGEMVAEPSAVVDDGTLEELEAHMDLAYSAQAEAGVESVVDEDADAELELSAEELAAIAAEAGEELEMRVASIQPKPAITQEVLDSIENIPKKMAFKIGEVAEMVGVKQYVLRYWESEFEQLRPRKSKNNQRVYTRRDVETALLIKKLLYTDRFSIEGARAALKQLKQSLKEERDWKNVATAHERAIERLKSLVGDIQRAREALV